MISDYEATTGEVRSSRCPEKVWDLHFEKMTEKLARKRHLLRRIGAHAMGLETGVARLVANTMVSGNAAFCAEITLPVNGHAKLDQQTMLARKNIRRE